MTWKITLIKATCERKPMRIPKAYFKCGGIPIFISSQNIEWMNADQEWMLYKGQKNNRCL